MQTLSLFPELLDYQLLGIFMIRVALGFFFVHAAYARLVTHRADGIMLFKKLRLHQPMPFFYTINTLELGAGLLLIAGLYTQAAAITTGTLMSIAALIKMYKPPALHENTLGTYFILAIVSFSLLFLGAGAFAIDLPL